MTARRYIYRDSAGKWRWRLRAYNGVITGASSEGFSTAAGAKENAKLVLRDLLSATVKSPRGRGTQWADNAWTVDS